MNSLWMLSEKIHVKNSYVLNPLQISTFLSQLKKKNKQKNLYIPGPKKTLCDTNTNFCPKSESCWLYQQCEITPFGNFMCKKNTNGKPNNFTGTSQKRDIQICHILDLLSLGVGFWSVVGHVRNGQSLICTGTCITIPFGPHRYWAQIVFSV